MNTLLPLPLTIVLATLGVLVIGNYMVNRGQGMPSRENMRETRMWGTGFFIYAVFDYFILVF